MTTQPKQSRAIPANNFAQLYDILGSGHDMALALGVTQTTVSNYKTSGKCPRYIELLAGMVLDKRNAKGTAHNAAATILVVRVPHDSEDLLKIFLKGMGLRYAHLKED